MRRLSTFSILKPAVGMTVILIYLQAPSMDLRYCWFLVVSFAHCRGSIMMITSGLSFHPTYEPSAFEGGSEREIVGFHVRPLPTKVELWKYLVPRLRELIDTFRRKKPPLPRLSLPYPI